MVNDLTLVVYTHSDYSDVWSPLIKRVEKFFPIKNKVVITNKIINNHFNDYEKLFYDDKLSYVQRLSNTLGYIKTNYIIYLHEDMILYDYVNEKAIENTIKFIENNKYNYVRLIKSGIKSNICLTDNLFLIDSSDVNFSITPTIWDRNKFIEICNVFKDMNLSIWEFELEADKYVKDNIKGLYWFNNEPKRGRDHYDSSIFPHLCSAIFKSKWNMEYKNELLDLFHEFKIDQNLRGTINLR